MECMAHNSRKNRLSSTESSLEAVKAILSIDPKRWHSQTEFPVDIASTHRRLISGTKPPHVCIVGAGMSGLRCAKVLADNGCQVTILEARDRVGGRVRQPLHLEAYY